jgi:monoamine oxidase
MSEHRIDRRAALGGALAGTAAAAFPGAASAAARDQRADVVVIGGGMAGLYAAEQLRARRSVVILEATDRVGGRVLNLKVGPKPDDVSEAGAQWIAPEQPIMRSLLRRFGLKTFKNYTRGASTLIYNGTVSRFEGATVPTLPNGGTADLLFAFGELTAMAAEVPVQAPWQAKHAAEWDSQTAQTWIDDHIGNAAAQALAEIAIGGPTSVQAQDISLLHYLFIAAAAGGPLNLVSVGSGVLSDRIVGGTGRLVDGLAAPMRNLISLNTPVTSIEHGRNSVRVTTPNGRWVAGHVILAMSPTMTQQILFDPVLPVPRTQSVQRTGNGSCIKAFPVYSTPFWRRRGLNGIVQSNSTPFAGVFDNSPPNGSPGVLFALIENVHARRLSQLSAAARKREVLDGLALAFGEQARHPIRYLEQDWSSEPWLRGGAASFFAPGLLSEYRYLFDQPIGRLHFAGTETGRAFWGNMEAALQTGRRAAGEVLRG